MSETIYGLKCDFEQQQGHFMTIFREEPSPIHSEELAKIQVNMMSANSIDHVLPLEVQEIDFNVKFYFDISSKKMLSHYVRESSLTMHDLYELLYEIGSVIKSSKELMLNEQQYVLHEDFIFVEDNVKQLYLTYIPLKEINQKPDLHQEYRELFFRLVGSVTELSGDGVQQLTSYLNGSNFQLDDLLKKLDSLRKNVSRQSVPSQSAPSEPEMKRIDYARPTVPSTSKQQSNRQNEATPKRAPSKPKQPVKKNEPNKQTEKEEIIEETIERKAPSPIIISCLALLGIAVIWRLYMSFPTEGIFYICIGLSIAIVAIGYYFLMVYPKATKKINYSTTGKKTKKNKVDKNLKKDKKVTTSHEISPRKVDNMEDTPPAKPHKPEVNSANYFQNLNHETTLLSQPESTVALDDSLQGAEPTAYLKVDRNGKMESIPINSESFIIGRQNDGVNYVEDSVGISRSHIEIVNNGTSFIVKDLGSKNGSKLNEESMIAYKTYPLKDGDQIRLAKIIYTFNRG
ncbi:FHA domain-containing protein [Gracilibacillus orientalis]|uniref:FHA domain-containing protein n=1 Tax=Gracilibacillus orientalis TaxID=334253 RepID=A0A1I4P5G6_9BACI|nr:DUF6382 domain-containing protein [Gracilibacillus orientalis]SFM22790.1 FHA domain-containing protein [Gracilibacillus orientalis]